MMLAELNILIEKVKSASGEDRHLDAAVDQFLGGWANPRTLLSPKVKPDDEDVIVVLPSVSKFTTDFGAVFLALKKRLPNSRFSIMEPASWADGFPVRARKKKPFEAWVTVGEIGTADFASAHSDHVSPPIALLDAFLSVVRLIEVERLRREEDKAKKKGK